MYRKPSFKLLIATAAVAGSVWFTPAIRGVEPAENGGRLVAVLDETAGGRESVPVSSVILAGHHRVGVGGCTAANCHGGDGTRGPVGSEYSLWVQEDKHAKAYEVLYNETSPRMAKLMKLDKPAHEAALCLNCHAPQNDPPFHGAAGAHSQLLDGVGCEACHGAASDWLAPHVRLDWRSKSAAEKSALGFRDTKDLWVRGQVCADCHVGEAGRDVNHDLYAAGHPRLFFELAAFNANIAKHWDPNKDRIRAAGGGDAASPFEAKIWAIGQLASAEAALDLLIHRAENAREDADVFAATRESDVYPAGETVPVWPELAEVGCFACHHDLKAKSWRQSRGYARRNPGGYPWGTWLFPLVPTVTSAAGGADLTGDDSSLGQLARQMAEPYPDQRNVVELARTLQQQLTEAAAAINSGSMSADQIQTLLDRLVQDGESATRQSWDGATQTYLGLVATHQALQDLRGMSSTQASDEPGTIQGRLKNIRDHLTFPDEFDSPREFENQQIDTIVEELKAVREQLRQTAAVKQSE